MLVFELKKRHGIESRGNAVKGGGEIKKLKKKIVPLLKQYGVRKAGIFGSYARGEAKKGSDIDILVKLKPGTSLLDVIRIEGEIDKRTKRKAELQSQIAVAGSLGVPIRKSDHIPGTFRIPEVRRKVIPKPTVPEGVGKPEPAIGDDIYQEILKVIHDTGKVFERLPSTYADKDEEALRDQLILILEPHFEISTTGETFNKSGKTDILMRYETSNVFVAECLWWDGPKKYLEKIDQLLSYLTWRDSKTAVVCFVGRKDFSNVLGQINEITQQHPCHCEPTGVNEETWHNYAFHLPGDPGRKIKLATLTFHLPRNNNP